MPQMESEPRQIRWQKDWLKMLDAECKATDETFAELVKEAVRREMKRRGKTLPELQGPGRKWPKKSEQS